MFLDGYNSKYLPRQRADVSDALGVCGRSRIVHSLMNVEERKTTLYLPINPRERRARRSWDDANATTTAGECQTAERRWLTSEKAEATRFLGGARERAD